MQDPVRQSMLARMGIQHWQLRRPALLGDAHQPAAMTQLSQPTQTVSQPTGKLWVVAPALPAATLLADICQLLGIRPDEVSLISALPASLPTMSPTPLLWLTADGPDEVTALHCPLAPNAAQKRALWQQLRQHLAANS
ncbi:MAG: DNA polymerase III subunit psi [Aeromonas sp.]